MIGRRLRSTGLWKRSRTDFAAAGRRADSIGENGRQTVQGLWMVVQAGWRKSIQH
ncbi:hypothetical protein D3C75_432440 [compost metagenome]